MVTTCYLLYMTKQERVAVAATAVIKHNKLVASKGPKHRDSLVAAEEVRAAFSQIELNDGLSDAVVAEVNKLVKDGEGTT